MIKIVVRVLIVVALLCLLGIGIVDYLKNVDENDCSLTYMKQPISLIPVPIDPQIQAQFPFYKLYLYCESFECHEYESLRFTRSAEIPALFITGNADSHKQVRSLASIASHKALKQKYARLGVRFHYFTIFFNEELSALYGPILHAQTEYTKHCIKHILGLFRGVNPEEKRPKSVLVVGNSMGGVIARGLFVRSEAPFNPKWVNTIITQATPHIRPVVNIDKKMSDYYEKVNNYWLTRNHTGLDHVVLVSLYGGVRDFLVRSGLSNINEWRNKSGAIILSDYTVSMPYVWRSADHRCMVWCRELIMAINRALFNMIDAKTNQLVEDRHERERVLRRHFETGFLYDENQKEPQTTIVFDESELVRITSEQEAFLSWNDFNSRKRLYLFDLTSLTAASLDSVFAYTNINTPNTILACQGFEIDSEKKETFKCTQPKELFSTYGRLLPPYIEDLKDQSLKTLNINNLKSELVEQGYKHLVVSIPVLGQTKSKYQLVLKLDWYKQSERFETLKGSPVVGHQVAWSRDDAANMRRYYLESFRSVWQAFDLVHSSPVEFSRPSSGASLKPLSHSNIVVLFHEPVSYEQSEHRMEQIYFTNAIQSKTKNLTLRLSVNHFEYDLIPYIDVIRFEPKHLVTKKDKSSGVKSSEDDSSSGAPALLEIKFNSIAMLGQFVRFYLPFLPVFLVAILQMYDLVLLVLKESSDELNSPLILNRFNANHLIHLVFSYLLAFASYLASFFGTDYQLLKHERVDNFLLAFLLYWLAYGLLNAICAFASLNHAVASFLVNRLVVPICSRLNSGFARKLGYFAHFVVTCVACFYASAITHCILFYSMLVKLALNNPRYSRPPFDHIRYLNRQTRAFLMYFLLALNLPSIIVWTKAIGGIGDSSAGIDGIANIRPLHAIMGDSGFFVAGVSIFIYLVYSLGESNYELKMNYFSLNASLLAALVTLNSFLTVLYSTVNLYRLQYFICIHLFLMCFMPRKPLKFKSD